MTSVSMFGLDFYIDPVAFTLPIGEKGWDVYWYGILIALGFLLAFIYGMNRAKHLGISTDKLLDGVIITTPIAIICTRAYYIIFSDNLTFADFFNFHDGGLAIYGGIIGAMIGAIISCKVRKFNLLDTIDLVAPGLFIGQAIGRWGNFFNQEAFGTNTDLPWGMYSEGSSHSTLSNGMSVLEDGFDPTLPVHPCFLYEFILCTIGFLILNYMLTRRKFKGQLILSYGVIYGVGRGFIEGIRTDSLMLGSLRISQVLSFFIAAICLVLLIVLFSRAKRKMNDEVEYTPIVEEGEIYLETEETSEEILEESEENEEEKIEEPEEKEEETDG